MKNNSSLDNSSVYIIDKHSIIRNSLTELISSRLGMRVIGSSGNSQKTLTIIENEKPDLLVIDIDMSTMSLISSIRRESDSTKILVYSGYNESVYSSKIAQLGANGFISKNHSFEILLGAISLVIHNINCFPNPSIQEQSDIFDQLSKRELSIAMALAKGLRNKEISTFFNISEKTVSTHKKNIFSKMNVNRVVDLASLFKLNDLID